MAPLTSLSPPLPHPSPSPAKPRRRPPPPPPPPHFTPSPRGPIRPATIVSAASGVTDGYHSTIRSLNSRGRHVPRKSLGQNYMLNSKVNEELVAAAGVGEGDVVLEIGPGTGSLTDALLAAGATVFAVEKIIEEDITKFNVHSHFLPFLEEKSHHSTKHAKVVSNLPFNISTDVVKLLLPMGDVFSIMVLLLQDETALRLADASIQTPEYRPINVFVNFYSEPEYKFKVERTNFFPQPKVDGAVISFKLKNAGEYPPVGSHKSSVSCQCQYLCQCSPDFLQWLHGLQASVATIVVVMRHPREKISLSSTSSPIKTPFFLHGPIPSVSVAAAAPIDLALLLLLPPVRRERGGRGIPSHPLSPLCAALSCLS
uniref:rRNA adenine N(6)-methyltransferase n=1 Tax=Leersia perrieri TaxID=77586 RepID=A0A0D9VBJ7_9ORYZ